MPKWNIKTPSKRRAIAYGLTYDPTGWEFLGGKADKMAWRKKATPEDIAALRPTRDWNDPVGEQQGEYKGNGEWWLGEAGGENNLTPEMITQEKTGMVYNPQDGYIYAEDPATPGTGGGPLQSILEVAAPFAAVLGAQALYPVIAGAGAAGAGAGAGAGTAGAAGAGAGEIGLGVTAGMGGAGEIGVGAGTAAGIGAGTAGAGAAGGAGAGASAGGGLTAGQMLQLGLAAAPVIAGALAPTGGQTVSQNTTTTNLPGYMQPGAEQMWTEYINSFYGLGGPTYKSKFNEDIEFVAGLENKLAGLIESQNEDAQGRRGMFTPTNISFGGQKVFDFVPRSNRALANEILQKAGASTALRTAHPPNEAESKYLELLYKRILGLVPQGNTSQTQTGTVPGPSTWANILQGLNAGANIYGAFNTQSQGKLVKNDDGTYSYVK